MVRTVSFELRGKAVTGAVASGLRLRPCHHPTFNRLGLTVLLGLLALILCGFGPPTLLDRDAAPRHRLTVGQLSQIRRARTPPTETSAHSVLVYDVDGERILMSKAIDLSISPASLAKLMTALLVLEDDRLSEQVEVLGEDLVGGAAMGIRGGEVLLVEELLWGLLVASGNDAAMALARHHSGNVEAFVQRMNTRAEDLNLQGTHYANPNGFDAHGQESNASDLLVLVRRLWQYSLFRQIVGTSEMTVASHDLQSTNQLLGSFPGANGVKTGTTLQSGQSLILGVEQDGLQVFAVILGSADRYRDARTVLAAVQRSYNSVALRMPPRPTSLDRVFDSSGRRWTLRPDGDAQSPDQPGAAASDYVMMAQWERQDLQVFRRVRPPPNEIWSAGMEAGVLEWRHGEDVIAWQRLVVR
ncbi:MAG: hypothetical protein OXO48_14165 [Caldilineaceae bacterium]|nr:hypothetical protein [Caldilineaceae bacterium]